MNTLRLSRLLCALGLLVAFSSRLAAADSPELAEARADLLAAFQRGNTDTNDDVKRLRAKIAALEYIAANAPATPSAAPSRLISVNFPGGPVSALITLADKTSPSGFNVIGEKADLTTELPPFSIRNADPSALANALNGILQPRGYTLASNVRTSPGDTPVFTLRKLGLYEGRIDQRLLPQFQSFQLSPYIGPQTVDDIVGAIRTAWELDPAQSPDSMRVKFHPPTGVLLVSGPQQAIILVESILKQLRRNPERPAKDPAVYAPPAAEKK